MGYFLKNLTAGTKKFWLLIAAMALWLFAILDLISSVAGSSLFNGILFYIMAVATAAALLFFLLYKYFKNKFTQKRTKAGEEHAALFEPKREGEIRRLYEKYPEFATHCYECIHFKPDLKHCSKNLSDDITQQRLKEVRIGNRKFCLYWERIYSM